MIERFELAKERIKEIVNENILPSLDGKFFQQEAEFILYGIEVLDKVESEKLCKLELNELRELNSALYSKYKDNQVDITNKYLCALSAEIGAIIPYIFEKDLNNILIRMELFLEFYSAYIAAVQDDAEVKDEDLRNILYYYVSDYTKDAVFEKIHNMLSMDEDFATKLIMNSDWSDIRSLYFYGEYVTEIEERTLSYLNSLPYDTLKKMADTFTEGYRIGFITTSKDITKKKIVGIRYNLGFEPVVKLAIENFKKMGLKPTISRARMNLLQGRGIQRIGYQGACPSRQYEFEHKDDASLILDKHINTIKLEALENAYEAHQKEASLYGGPAVMEVFGEIAPQYELKDTILEYTEEQNKLITQYASKAMAIQNKYIKEEERSFTIIAFPTPDIGEPYDKIFDEVIKLNTLDYKLYQTVQQNIIDTLDLGEYAIVKGMNGNKTNLKVSLHKLGNPAKETKFENCVADVNIPVGEVFTSPVLKDTEGVLHVKKVFLNGLEYKNIMLTIRNGMVKEYTCSNFDTDEENQKFIKDNVLYHHDTLPMGEFAIGTNTTAFVMARKYGIEDKLPILIAEKTGPHFAFGDTCYSHAEDVKVYNPDGKEIIAKENECSLKRDEDPMNAYFNCHTDVTIPYDELGEISIVKEDNSVVTIIENGRFVLEGTMILNEALDSMN